MTPEMKERINNLAEELNEMWLDAPEDSLERTSWHLLAKHVLTSEIKARIEEIELNMTVDSERLNKKRIAELQQQLKEVEG